jgi:outer membrane receptor protein involved in Fe transport
VLLFGLAATASAQSAATGNVDGVVTDNTGGALPGVTVNVRNTNTGLTRQEVTDGVGHYRVVALPPGTYEVKATLQGFEANPVTNVEVLVGQTASVDVKMHPAGVAETVTVTGAETPAIDTKRTGVSDVIGQTEIQNLPVVGRRWDNFVLMSPGVTNDANFGLVSYRGISGLYNNNMVDGVDNNQALFSEARGRTRIAYAVSESSIKEFQVGVSNMSAEFGRSAGGTVNAVTKSGTNSLSGEGFYYVRTDSLQAQNPLIVLPQGGKPNENRQQFGGAVGGPLKANKAFFFFDYDQQYRNFPLYTTYFNPTFPTMTCTAPAANCQAALNLFNSWVGLSPRQGNNKVFLAKVDVLVDPSNQLSLSINSHRWNSPNGVQTQPTATVADNMNGTDSVQTDFFVASLNTVLSQRMVNELRMQAGRDYEEQTPNGVPPATTVSNGINFGMPNFLPRAAYPHEQRYEFIDSMTYFKGAHSVKFGADINYVREQLINLFQGGGTYAYSGPGFTAIANDCPIGAVGCTPVAASQGQHYTTFMQAFDLNNLGGKLNFSAWQQAFYVQDTWRVNDRIVANLGLRYDYQSLPEPGSVTVDGVGFNGNPALPLTTSFHQDRNNFGPRLGMAYDLNGKHDTVVKASWGVFYGLTSNSAVANALTNNGINQVLLSFTPTSPGAPQYPNTFATVPNVPGARTINELDPNLQRPTIQMFDASVEHQLPSDITVSASYLYSHGSHLPIFRDTNLSPANSTVTYMLDGQNMGSFPFYRGARPNPAFNAIMLLDSQIVTSNYNAMVLQVNKRFSKGLMLNAHYTLSSSRDNGQESTTFFSGSSELYDPFSGGTGPDGQSPSSFDRRHRFVGTGFWRADKFWDIGVSGVLTLESGLPISQNISGGSYVASVGVPASGTNGTGGASFAPWLGRNSARQTGRQTFDLRVSKVFSLQGSAKLEVLVDVFNLFNHINYTSASNVAFSVPSGGATYDPVANAATVVLNHSTGFLVPSAIGNTLYGMREGQIGFKFSW